MLYAAGDAQRTGCYIVVLKEATTSKEFKDVLDRVVGMAEDAKLYGSVTMVAKAFTVKLSLEALEEVRHYFVVLCKCLPPYQVNTHVSVKTHSYVNAHPHVRFLQ